jgi:hypothetical protein
MRRILAFLSILAYATAAIAQQSVLPVGPPAFVLEAFSYKHITTLATTVVKSAPGVLHTVCISTPAATETVTLYDNTTASGTVIAVITSYAAFPTCLTFDVVFTTGLIAVSATAAGDITISFL